MEIFKTCEREMKTKAFSKEGLTLATRLDPKEKAKQDIVNWITKTVDVLSTRVNVCETEIEKIYARPKKNIRSVDVQRVSTIEAVIQRHKWHMGRLELALRLLENGSISVEQVMILKQAYQRLIVLVRCR
jgi:CCR4-NOT transcription complex subunit 3